MQALKDIITGICLALMAAGLLRMLAPENGAGKLLRVIISLFVLCAIIVPFSGGVDFNFDISAAEPAAQGVEDLNDILISQRERLAADKIKEQIEFILAKYDIQNEGYISVEMERLEDGTISVGEITLYLPEEYMKNAGDIVRSINSELGLEVVVAEE